MGLFNDLSAGLGAVSDLFGGEMGSQGYKTAAQSYQTASTFATKNAQVAQESGDLQEAQANRQIYQAVSGGEAAAAAGGTTGGGSNQYIQRASQQQGGLQKAIIAAQTQVNVTGFKAEAASDVAQGQMAQQQAKAAKGGGILGAVGSILSIF